MSRVPYGARWRELALQEPQRAAVTVEAQTLTRWELETRSNQRARFYLDAGVGWGDFVTLAAQSSLDFYIAVMALWKIGAVPQPVSPKLSGRELAAIVECVNPKLLLGFAPADFPQRKSVSLGHEAAAGYDEQPLPAPRPNSFRASTSGGSTGLPKVIVSGLLAEWDRDGPPFFEMRANQVQLIPGPNYQAAPYTMASFGLMQGHHLVIMTRFDAEQALRLMERFRVNWVFMVPTMMQRIARLPDELRRSVDLSALHCLLHSAAPCPVWLKKAWIEWIGPEHVFEVYGGSEGTGTTWISGAESLLHPGSVGRCIGARIRICDTDGNECPAGQVGEIYFIPNSGPGSTYRYLGAQTRRLLPGGWESLGDLGWLDAQGYLYLADRRTDMILSGGANVYPAEIENCLSEHPAVQSCAVIGLPGTDMGNIIHAIVQPAAPVSAEELLLHLQGRLAKYKLPRSLEFVDYPLRDESGKSRRFALREERIERLKLRRNDVVES